MTIWSIPSDPIASWKSLPRIVGFYALVAVAATPALVFTNFKLDHHVSAIHLHDLRSDEKTGPPPLTSPAEKPGDMGELDIAQFTGASPDGAKPDGASSTSPSVVRMAGEADATRDRMATEARVASAARERRAIEASRTADDEVAWSSARLADTISDYEKYLNAFPGGAHVQEARTRIDARVQIADDAAAWNAAMQAADEEGFITYQKAFPNGEHAAEARRRIAGLVAHRQRFAGASAIASLALRERAEPQPVVTAGAPQPTAIAAAQPPRFRRRPLDCASASRGSDFVICAFPDLRIAETNLEHAYNAAQAADREKELGDQVEWDEKFGQGCGLPAYGAPSTKQIHGAHACVLAALKNRTAKLNAKPK